VFRLFDEAGEQGDGGQAKLAEPGAAALGQLGEWVVDQVVGFPSSWGFDDLRPGFAGRCALPAQG
jgi:hypothetical protein